MQFYLQKKKMKHDSAIPLLGLYPKNPKPKNTNLKGWAVLCYAKSFQLCPTLSSLMDYSPPGSSIHGIPQARRLERVVGAFLQGILHTQGSNPHFLHISCTGRQVLYHLGSPLKRYMHPNTHSSIIYNSQIWKQYKCSSTDEWIKMWCFIYVYIYMYMYIYTHTHTHSAILLSHKNEILPFAATWMDLELVNITKKRSRLIDTEKKPVVTRGEREAGRVWGSGRDRLLGVRQAQGCIKQHGG